MPPKRSSSTGSKRRSSAFVPAASSGTQDRIKRALTQRLFLVDRTIKSEYEREYAILGSTGNLYNVIIGERVQCSCPDYQFGHLCKHVIFTMIRVLQLDRKSEYVYQKGLLQNELKAIFYQSDELEKQRQKQNGFIPLPYASKNVLNAYRKATGKPVQTRPAPPTATRKEIKGECPICFDDLEQGECVWCREQWEKTEEVNDDEDQEEEQKKEEVKEEKGIEIGNEEQGIEKEEQGIEQDEDDEEDLAVVRRPKKRTRKQMEEEMEEEYTEKKSSKKKKKKGRRGAFNVRGYMNFSKFDD
ncbi:MAG: putative null domain protein [Streblomastix strix]|uniref:Putative null domain protein n=1 Tax=Streblomastix strix TaxID=222440 RepID=A0A5J4VVF3_9EUKA|nr:MAG: putative null domain protein [Streblomastix strix]